MTTAERIARLRQGPVVALTAYDYPTARVIDECGIDLILVGDSVGMVFAGQPDTTTVTMDQMIYHTTVVRRGTQRALLVADLPYQTYQTPAEAAANARRLVDAGAEAVKLEGGTAFLDQIRAIIADGIPFVGHIGMLPQSILEERRYRKKGKVPAEAEGLLADAAALEEAGAIAVVLESIVPALADAITRSISIPTIGIGSGPGCGGQILVIHDLIGLFPWFTPPFVQPKVQFADLLRDAATRYIDEVRNPR